MTPTGLPPEDVITQAQQLTNEVAEFREEVRRENQIAHRYFKMLLAAVVVGAFLAIGVGAQAWAGRKTSQSNAQILELVDSVLDPEGEYQRERRTAAAEQLHVITCTILLANNVAPPDCEKVRVELRARQAPVR